jgi:hypothetical protein
MDQEIKEKSVQLAWAVAKQLSDTEPGHYEKALEALPIKERATVRLVSSTLIAALAAQSQDEERFIRLSAEVQRLRDVDSENKKLHIAFARAEARVRELEAAAAQERGVAQ